jgi:nucleoside-diphosphate-sugar epimerase
VNVLVTGATGFIGSHVVTSLLSRGHTVDAFVRPGGSSYRLNDGSAGLSIWPVDLSDGAALTAALARVRADALIHLAWYTEPGAYLRDTARNLASLENSLRLLRMIGEGPTTRVVLAGTCLEADRRRGTADEPIYAVAKRALHEVAVNGLTGDLRVTCAHVFSVFGPREDERRAVPSVIRSLLRGDPVDVSTGTQLRDYVHVADVADAFATIVESDVVGGIDVCTGEARPLGEVFEEIGRATGRGELIRRAARATGADEGFDAVGDPGPLEALGWCPKEPFSRRIGETVEWWAIHQQDQNQVLLAAEPAL